MESVDERDEGLSASQVAAIASIRAGEPVVYRVTFHDGEIGTTTGADLNCFESVLWGSRWSRVKATR
jgi:hypothetical protein